jgi:2'-5' RNA ligase
LLKEEIAEKYKSKYSLKIPEHITLIPPFHCSDEMLETLCNRLNNLCVEKKPFEVLLKDFSHFGKAVLYIQASSQPPELIQQLHTDLLKLFFEEFSSMKIPQSEGKFTPHLTIANRDLTKQKFKEAWHEFAERKFEERFMVKSIFLLRHIDGIWKPEKEIKFAE